MRLALPLLVLVLNVLQQARISVCSGLGEKLTFTVDKSFPPSTVIGRRNVTCEEGKRTQFVSETWTCTNIKVDGVRLPYGYPPKMTSNKMCGEDSGLNNIIGLCQAMLHKMKVTPQMWTAFVSDGICHNETQPRVEYRRIDGAQTFSWFDIPGTRVGYIRTLQCMVEKRP